MGLLDQFSEFAKTPEGQGLLSAAFGGLAGARRGQPLNSIGRAGLAGLQGYGGALDRQSQEAEAAFQKQFRTSQMEDLQRKRAKDQAQEQWRTQLPGLLAPKLQGETEQSRMLAEQMGPDATPEDVNAMNSGARMPQAGFTFAHDKQALDRHLMDANSPFADKLLEQRLFPKAPERKVVGKTVLEFGADGAKPIWSEPEQIDPNKPFMLVDGKPVPNEAYQGYELTKAATGATRVNQSVNASTPYESEQDKVYGKGIGEMRLDIDRNAFAAPKTLANLDRMEQLLAGTTGGNMAGFALKAASAAASMGLKIDPKLGDKEAAEALSIEMALAQRPVGSGPMTDKDFENFLNTVPGLSKTPEGRAQITSTLRAKAQRDVEIGKLARAHAARNGGRFSQEFQDEVAQYVASNPVWRSGSKDEGGPKKVMSMSDIEATARASGKTPEEVTRAAKSRGYEVR